MLRRSLMLLRRQTGGRSSVRGLDGRWLRPRELALLGALAVLAVVLVQPGSARLTDIKRYDACLQNATTSDPACSTATADGGSHTTLPGGGTAHLSLTLTNEGSSNQSLGSANINAPSQLPIVTSSVGQPSQGSLGSVTSSQIQLRSLNLAPGGSATVTFNVTTPCSGSGFKWTVPAKQSNNFQGTGNDFQLIVSTGLTTDIAASSCHLEFVRQPASAKINTLITDTAYNPDVTTGANYVAVKAVGGDGQTITSASGSVTLSPSGGSFTGASAPFASGTGVATFSSFMGTSVATAVTVVASATGFGSSDPSGPFDISLDGTSCVGEDPCVLSTPLANSQVDTQANGGNFTFVVINAADDLPSSGCENFIGTNASGFEETDSRTGDGSLDFTYYIKDKSLKQVYGANYGQPNVPLCAGAKRLVNNQPVACNASGGGPGWMGKAVDPVTHKVVSGSQKPAVCGDGGYWWGVLGNFQDPNPPFDSLSIPLITGWGSTPDGVFRTYTVHVPSGWDWKLNG
jgi:hypothetical protein